MTPQIEYCLTRSRRVSGRRQELVHERDHHTAFAHAGGDALHGAGTNVAHRKDPWNRGFKQVGVAFDRPAVSSSIRSGDHVALRIPFDRCGARHNPGFCELVSIDVHRTMFGLPSLQVEVLVADMKHLKIATPREYVRHL